MAATSTGNNDNSKMAEDKMSLLAIKAGVSLDPLGVLSSWTSNGTGLHFCSWHGVTCDGRNQRVTTLNLQSSMLTGTISPYIGNLSFLTGINLQNNSFMGRIPSEIGGLQGLQHLLLSNNSFGGEIPSNISACTSLTVLEAAFNQLVGRIPSELGSLSMLQNFTLYHNKLIGHIPSSLGNLSSLRFLSLGENNFIGKIPNSLGKLKSLTFLSLYENQLSGVFPPSIFNLSSLIDLALTNNHLEGTLPSDLGLMLPKIQRFLIAYNSFSGSLPVSLFNSSHLVDLQMGVNNFHGQVPLLYRAHNLRTFSISFNYLGTGQSNDLEFVSSLANSTKLEVLDIGGNNLTGKFPEIICNFSRIFFLNLRNNDMVGQIPTCIGNLASLRRFASENNLISGSIPSSIGNLKNLGQLILNNNKLSGHIPNTIGNLTQLSALILYQNNLQGPIPSSFESCRNLQLLTISSNNFTGKLPLEIITLPNLIALDLSQNNFSGSVPTEIGRINNINELYLQENMLSGEIPSTLSDCLELEFLYMEGNRFEGSIPSAFITMKGLKELDLSRNNLSGNIPKFLGSLNLTRLNLSYNNFEGEVPSGGIFRYSSNFSLFGNKRLCGGIPEFGLPQCDLNKTLKGGINNKKKLILIIVSSLFGVAVLVGCALYIFFYRKKRQTPKPSCDIENTFTNLSYQNLLKATNGFSSENMIGSGTFGVVYKGTLDEDQTTIAIKKFNLDRKAAVKSFIAECGALQNIRHRNLVKVITACSSIDHQGNDFKALVYEYMENGSLQDWLHPNPSINVTDARKVLNLYQRFNIATNVAFALEYLHHRCGTLIVHCDLKPSNILLNKEMTAHVGDFGLAKFLIPSDIVGSQDNQSSTIGIRGTVGYTPPEYGMGNEVSTQGDVYSFGILLLELFTGKKPVDDMFKDGLNLRRFVKATLPHQVTDILDHHLINDLVGDEGDTSRREKSSNGTTNRSMILEALVSVLDIALACSDEAPQERLGMSDVASKLSSIINKLLGTQLRKQRRNLAH